MNTHASNELLRVEQSITDAIELLNDLLDAATEGVAQFDDQDDDCRRLREVRDNFLIAAMVKLGRL